jgi:hypothetical protein
MSQRLYGFHGPLAAAGGPPRLRRFAASVLRRTSRWLARLSKRVAERRREARELGPIELEFYAEAGAPEGALYLNGKLVGTLQGVNRL